MAEEYAIPGPTATFRQPYYPADWPQELISGLEKHPRWKPYWWPTSDAHEKICIDMLQHWSAKHGALIMALKVIQSHGGKVPWICLSGERHEALNIAVGGIVHAMERGEDDLDDIIVFIAKTMRYHAPTGEEPTRTEPGAVQASAEDGGDS